MELDAFPEQQRSLAPLTLALPYNFRSVRAGEFMGREASFYTVHDRRVIIGYRDAAGSVSTRQLTVKEVISCTCQVYISGFCHLREDARSFRLDRISFMMRGGRPEQVHPNVEVLRWLLDC